MKIELEEIFHGLSFASSLEIGRGLIETCILSISDLLLHRRTKPYKIQVFVCNQPYDSEPKTREEEEGGITHTNLNLVKEEGRAFQKVRIGEAIYNPISGAELSAEESDKL
ncbi:hypothetical protein F2Q68_00038051 [Brassica cretica]|uniref:Uncharacterized protein n=1 Tax=Brassica cretica TaxID=69181 RepID=A0A8S9H8E0_BRACR|nr:hypothetical protein F2Q68_00038051 [Brassica cretica]